MSKKKLQVQIDILTKSITLLSNRIRDLERQLNKQPIPWKEEPPPPYVEPWKVNPVPGPWPYIVGDPPVPMYEVTCKGY